MSLCLMAEGKREDEHKPREHMAKTGGEHFHTGVPGTWTTGPEHRME